MLIPFHTDAPVYYFPFATIGLIAVNVVLGLLTFSGTVDLSPWILHYGGIHPTQWFTSIFLHSGLIHLIGNMIFLWGFGLVVEGKLGWWKFLLVYLGIGAGQSALEQLFMLGSSGGSLGASSAIFGLVAISWVWAPKNEMSCFLLIRFFPTVIEVSIMTFGGIYFGWELLCYMLSGFSVSSSFLHLMGIGIGLGVGIVMLKTGKVDCEGWDVFSVLAGKDGSSQRTDEYLNKSEVSKQLEQEEAQRRAEHLQAAQQQIGTFLENGHNAAAWKLYEKMGGAESGLILEEPQLLQIIKDLHDQQQWKDTMRVMEQYVRRFPEKSIRMRLRLAQLHLEQKDHPITALTLLDEIDAATLPENYRKPYQRLLSEARKLQDEGDLELDAPP